MSKIENDTGPTGSVFPDEQPAMTEERELMMATYAIAFRMLFLILTMACAIMFGNPIAAVAVVIAGGLVYVCQTFDVMYDRHGDPFYYNVAMVSWIGSVIMALAAVYLLAYDASQMIA